MVQLKKDSLSFRDGSGYDEPCIIETTKLSDFSVNKNWYMQLKDHPFKSELNIMSNDLIPLSGCNQGLFVPYFLD